MYRMSVFYPRAEESEFDMAYYLSRHIPLMQERLGAAMARFEVDRGLGGAMPGEPPPYAAVGHFFFATRDDLRALGPHARDINADVPNFTSVTPVVQISEVVEL